MPRPSRGRDGTNFGRGPIPTHAPAVIRQKFGLGVPLRPKPGSHIDPQIGADIAVSGKTWPNNTPWSEKSPVLLPLKRRQQQ